MVESGLLTRSLFGDSQPRYLRRELHIKKTQAFQTLPVLKRRALLCGHIFLIFHQHRTLMQCRNTWARIFISANSLSVAKVEELIKTYDSNHMLIIDTHPIDRAAFNIITYRTSGWTFHCWHSTQYATVPTPTYNPVSAHSVWCSRRTWRTYLRK